MKISFSSSVGRAQGWKPWSRWFESSLKHLNLAMNSSLTKLFFKYIFLKTPFLFVENKRSSSSNEVMLFLTRKNLIYTILHLRTSSVILYPQLIEMFSYEIPQNSSSLPLNFSANESSSDINTLVVYNFVTIQNEKRFFLVTTHKTNLTGTSLEKKKVNQNWLYTIENYFIAANWLEREVAEFFNISFQFKRDIRNLMLQYGDTSAPLLKMYPVVGLKEYYFNSTVQQITQSFLTLKM
uniref:NADH dehydrogenase subunit 9 n=1 Tax=Strombidium cf. sulcatum TaxID=2793073 RepID=A0A7T0M4Y4_9SPIT|nr:NADH dehydrogenase subunit 9 [Strombidium cf. sulcatum]QPL15962.1 NADH dehydrogenase subunit 9 [Strombidium cf. sulcatum]